MDCSIILPADEEFKCGGFLGISTVRDKKIESLFITVKNCCCSCSIRRGDEGGNSTGMKFGDDVCDNMSTADIVLYLVDYFIGTEEFWRQLVVRCL